MMGKRSFLKNVTRVCITNLLVVPRQVVAQNYYASCAQVHAEVAKIPQRYAKKVCLAGSTDQ